MDIKTECGARNNENAGDNSALPHGTIFDLAVALEPGIAHHPTHPPFSYETVRAHPRNADSTPVSFAMEQISLGTHVGTHVDAPCHIAVDGCIHSDFIAVENEYESGGYTVGSVDEVPPILGQGHLVDAELLLGRKLTQDDGIDDVLLQRWFGDRPQPQPGSVVLIRTGWMRYWGSPEKYTGTTTGLPGVTIDGARWMTDRQIQATGSDTLTYEHKPDPRRPATDVHVHNLRRHGIPIMECMNLEQLARAKCYEFEFIAIPLKIRGGTGSPIRPLAIAPSVAGHAQDALRG